jgi:hypothetical protein
VTLNSLKATGNAPSEDPEDEEKGKKWEAMKAHIGAARADVRVMTACALKLKC